MAKVALVSPPFLTDYMRNARCDFVSLSHSSWYPLWLGQAGSWLEGKGHKTILLDAQVMGLSTDQTISTILAFKPDLVAVYSGRLSEDSDISFADLLELKGLRTVFVGPYASIDPKGLLQKSKRTLLAIQREFDLPLEELVTGKSSIPNLLIKDPITGTIHENPIRALYKTEVLDQFPLTSKYFHEHLSILHYKTPSELYPFLDVMSGRGCAWGRCNFCLWVQNFIPGSVYNLRSIDNFLEEFRYITQKIPEVKSIMIQDDMLTNSRAIEISEGILRNNYSIAWSCYAKPNSKLTFETLKLMKKSGCLNLHVGFESGDDDVLKKIEKGSNVEQAKEFAAAAHEAGLQIHGDFAIGHLGETRHSVNRTITLAKEINPHTAQFQIMIPFRNTKFWRDLESNKLLNPQNEPSYEKIGGVSADEIRKEAKRAYRAFYLSPTYFIKIIRNPRDYFFNRFDQYLKAIPAVFWKQWTK